MTAPNQNILFISIEDLNDWIEPLGGHPDTITPNLQRLADRAALFSNAYTPAPACSPARTAALFGRNPWETGVYDNTHKWWHGFNSPETSIMGRMKQAGYTISGAGKVFHGGLQPTEDALWDAFRAYEKPTDTAISQAVKSGLMEPENDFGPIPNEQPHMDQQATDFILDRMKSGAQGQFWALGLYRPHLPLLVPQRFFDALPETISLPPGMQSNQFDPNDLSQWDRLPKAAQRLAKPWTYTGQKLHKSGEYNAFLRAYLASIHYADYLLGQVLDHMDETGLWENTHLVLWSDHGWQVGEKLTFRKFTLWERALRIPLMIAGPTIKPSKIDAPVSLIDLAPTILYLTGQPRDSDLTGQNLLSENLREFTTSIWGIKLDTDTPKYAISVRSKTHRLNVYWTNEMELYDHSSDPYEHNNLLYDSENIAQHEKLLDTMMAEIPTTMADPAWTKPAQ
jgi:arylsulfatase A-like enzyme